MKRNDLQMIMRRAWTIARATGKAFAVALAKSWQLWRLTKQMRVGIVRFAYEKADGTLRRAMGTLHEVAATIKGNGRPNNALTIRYYDVEASGWRSFKVENFITIY